MEYSTNFNFSLPSRDNDVDLADINEISNNFRKIDENAVKKENIDKKYSATSENAQSGLAVAEALGTIVKDLEEVPADTVDRWEYNKIYKGVRPENFLILQYAFDDGTSKSMGELLPISIVVKCKQTVIDITHGTYNQDIVYNFDGQKVKKWAIDPKYKTIVPNEFIPIDESKAVTEISETATNNQYPTALAVKNYMNASIDQTYSPESSKAQSGVAVAEAVKKAGVRKIRHIELGTGETANTLKISTDEDGNPFELSKAFFTAHFVFDSVSGTNAAIRIRTDDGQRYLVIKTGVSLSNGIITCGGTINAHGGILTTSAVYSTTDNPQTADTIYGMIAKAKGITHNLKNIEAFLLVQSQLELKEGSFLELWGC